VSGKHDQGKALPVTPAGWVPLSAAIAWVAQGTAVVDWDARFYFSANWWPSYAPSEVARALREIVQGKPPSERSFSTIRIEVDRLARNDLGYGQRENIGDILAREAQDEQAQAARRLVEGLIERLETADEVHESFWTASEQVRRAAKDGKVHLFGFRGDPLDFNPQYDPDEVDPIVKPRERIPPEVFAAPVTLGRNGIRPFARGDETPGGYEYLWSDILFDAEGLLGLRAAADSASRPYVPQPEPQSAKEERRGRKRGGGRKEDYDWWPFRRELVAKLSRDGGNLTRGELTNYLNDWATMNMRSFSDPSRSPDDTSVRRHIEELVEEGLIPD
jgi:hypothetical protein